MNFDNQRLKDIQLFKKIYYKEFEKAETVSDCVNIRAHIDELEKEEKEILERFDVKL